MVSGRHHFSSSSIFPPIRGLMTVFALVLVFGVLYEVIPRSNPAREKESLIELKQRLDTLYKERQQELRKELEEWREKNESLSREIEQLRKNRP